MYLLPGGVLKSSSYSRMSLERIEPLPPLFITEVRRILFKKKREDILTEKFYALVEYEYQFEV